MGYYFNDGELPGELETLSLASGAECAAACDARVAARGADGAFVAPCQSYRFSEMTGTCVLSDALGPPPEKLGEASRVDDYAVCSPETPTALSCGAGYFDQLGTGYSCRVWTFRGRVAATPRLRRGSSVETSLSPSLIYAGPNATSDATIASSAGPNAAQRALGSDVAVPWRPARASGTSRPSRSTS